MEASAKAEVPWTENGRSANAADVLGRRAGEVRIASRTLFITVWLSKGGHGDIGTSLSGMGPINLEGVAGASEPKTWIFDVFGPGRPPGSLGGSELYALSRSASF